MPSIGWMDVIGGVTERRTAPGMRMSPTLSARSQRKTETLHQFKINKAYSIAKFLKKRVDMILA